MNLPFLITYLPSNFLVISLPSKFCDRQNLFNLEYGHSVHLLEISNLTPFSHLIILLSKSRVTGKVSYWSEPDHTEFTKVKTLWGLLAVSQMVLPCDTMTSSVPSVQISSTFISSCSLMKILTIPSTKFLSNLLLLFLFNLLPTSVEQSMKGLHCAVMNPTWS